MPLSIVLFQYLRHSISTWHQQPCFPFSVTSSMYTYLAALVRGRDNDPASQPCEPQVNAPTPCQYQRDRKFSHHTSSSPPTPKYRAHHHLQTPAFRITPSNSSTSTPRATPAPPLASRIMSLSSSSSTSSFSTAATRRRCASVMGPAWLLVKSRNASSSSARCASEFCSRPWNLSAQMAKKGSYVAKPSESGSRIERNSRSSAGDEGGMPRALAAH